MMSNGIVTGPGMRREIFIFKWLYNILQDKPVVLEGGGQTRDVIYVSDVLDAWELVIDADKSKVIGQKFQVSYGEEHSVSEILQMCLDVYNKKGKIKIINNPYRPGEERQREWYDNSKTKQILGYNPFLAPCYNWTN